MLHLIPDSYSLIASILVLVIAVCTLALTLCEERITHGDPDRRNLWRKSVIALLIVGIVLLLIK